MDRYRDRLQQSNGSNTNGSRDSSVSSYSTSSTKKLETSEYSEYAPSTRSTASRPYSFTPSYMSAAVPTRKPVGRPMSIATGLNANPPTNTAPAKQSPVPAPLEKGVLLLAIAARPHSSTISYLKMLLQRGPYSKVVIVGETSQEAALKQLKMDIWALLGKMSLEVGVQMELQKSWVDPDVWQALSELVAAQDILSAVLCSPKWEDGAWSDILSGENEAFEESWKQTVGFVRSLAKATIKILRPSPTSRAATGLFVVTESKGLAPIPSINKAACDNMIAQLADGHRNLTIAYADSVLIPEPSPVEQTKTPVSAHVGLEDIYYGDHGAQAESPTKLWNMWALQDEIATEY